MKKRWSSREPGGAVGPRPGCGARRTSRGITSRAGGVPLGKRDEKASCEHCPEECVCARARMYMRTGVNVYACARVPVYMHMCVRVCLCMRVCAYGYVRMCTRMSIQLHVCILVAQLYPTSCDAPGSSVHGISQAGILEWVATSFSRGSS